MDRNDPTSERHEDWPSSSGFCNEKEKLDDLWVAGSMGENVRQDEVARATCRPCRVRLPVQRSLGAAKACQSFPSDSTHPLRATV